MPSGREPVIWSWAGLQGTVDGAGQPLHRWPTRTSTARSIARTRRDRPIRTKNFRGASTGKPLSFVPGVENRSPHGTKGRNIAQISAGIMTDCKKCYKVRRCFEQRGICAEYRNIEEIRAEIESLNREFASPATGGNEGARPDYRPGAQEDS